MNTVAEFVTEQNVESAMVESIVESLDANRVVAFWGEKHSHIRSGNAGRHDRRGVTFPSRNGPYYDRGAKQPADRRCRIRNPVSEALRLSQMTSRGGYQHRFDVLDQMLPYGNTRCYW
jgi:hypothetical protein